MSDEALLDAVREVARRHLGWEGELDLDTPLVEALRLDSLRTLTLVVELENRLQVTLEEGDETGITTTRDLLTVLRRRLEAAASASGGQAG